MELVDTLLPPHFLPSGVVKERTQAYADGDWVGGFNLWIVQSDPVPALVLQERSQNSSWEPGKLDVSAGGHYMAGEVLTDGMREVEEELGKHYEQGRVHYVGRKMNVSTDIENVRRHAVIDIGFAIDNAPLSSYTLQPEEVTAIFICPLHELIRVYGDEQYSFTAQGMKQNGSATERRVDQSSFPYNWDNYHYKIALLAQRYLDGETPLLY